MYMHSQFDLETSNIGKMVELSSAYLIIEISVWTVSHEKTYLISDKETRWEFMSPGSGTEIRKDAV